jgi:16S rRNA (guanine527-N7)-methyltransferase
VSPNDPWSCLKAQRGDLDWERLESYAREIERWNRAIRLVGPKDLAGIRLQIADALLPFLLVPPEFPLLDIGSGAGLPGIPIAISFPGRAVVCLEPLAKRVSFLHQAVRHLGLRNVRVVAARAEDAIDRHPELSGAFASVTARAVAETAALVPLGRSFLHPLGRFLLPRGQEEAPSPAGWRLAEERRYAAPEGLGERRLFVYVREDPGGGST